MIGSALRYLVLGTPLVPVLRSYILKVWMTFVLSTILLVMMHRATLMI